ncbi:putative F-box protein At4g09190 [Triticum aestivum]|uniref:putative F-box protein At4g09190 n=1 Tax=Triticum aestivum TaxID=4565 RepID=UPI001D010E8C|nr:putative F-box protein At4g09190 [Triticum aestivum]
MSAPAVRSPPWEEGHTSARIRSFGSPPNGTAAERLTDDLIVEILSRVPAKSLCRFKCVSNHWLSLIDHPDHRKKLPQTLAGFFYTSTDFERFQKSAHHLANVSGRSCPPIDTSFSFLPNHRRVDLLDCCSGLLLCARTLPGVTSAVILCAILRGRSGSCCRKPAMQAWWWAQYVSVSIRPCLPTSMYLCC